MKLDEIREYFKVKKTEFDCSVIKQLNLYKKQAVKEVDESLANKIWCYEQIAAIQNTYISVYNNLKKKEYFTAWKDLEHIDIILSFLRTNYNYSAQKDEFQLNFIQNIIREYEKLFP